eukprot:Lithocolla_globosa_v1_NODE_2893_length_1832_cov_141.536297.p2 type:complete len:176 gc:universal NODE_2893_length_1832_cov_141.536297:625-1152(+)
MPTPLVLTARPTTPVTVCTARGLNFAACTRARPVTPAPTVEKLAQMHATFQVLLDATIITVDWEENSPFPRALSPRAQRSCATKWVTILLQLVRSMRVVVPTLGPTSAPVPVSSGGSGSPMLPTRPPPSRTPSSFRTMPGTTLPVVPTASTSNPMVLSIVVSCVSRPQACQKMTH